MPFGPSHKIILSIARSAVYSFFSGIRIINEENVPKDAPVIIVCTHHNMSVDPAVLSSTFPHGRYLHYWAKASLFKNPWAKAILLDAGNIPVERKATDKRSLFKGTFDVLAVNEVVALFPEGTSYTEPRIMQVKDGAAWAALEYTKWSQSEEGKSKNAQELYVIPAGLVYTNKSKYRSTALIEFGKPIPLASLAQEFVEPSPDSAKMAVKKLTRTIEKRLVELTINAPDWETLYAARMARDLLWGDERNINPDEFVGVSQLLVDLFASSNACPSFKPAKEALLKYSSLLKVSYLSNEALSSLPLPRSLDPSHAAPLPSRLSTLLFLLLSTFSIVIRLPFFVIPLAVHIPVYVMSRYGADLALDEEETQAQNKIVFGLLLTAVSYGFMFWFIWAVFWLKPLGAAFAAGVVWLVHTYHGRVIDDVYRQAKRLVTAWRVLIGVWGPRRWDLNVSALTQYTIPTIPPPNPWIERPAKPASGITTPTSNVGASAASTAENPKALAPQAPKAKKRSKRPSSRTLVRHVLRARIDASRALANFLQELHSISPRVRVSYHIGHPDGQFEDGYVSGTTGSDHDGSYVDAGASATASTPVLTPSLSETDEPKAHLEGREIVRFLRDRGAKITELHVRNASDWAAAPSGASSSEAEDNDHDRESETHGQDTEVVWVSPSTSSDAIDASRR